MQVNQVESKDTSSGPLEGQEVVLQTGPSFEEVRGGSPVIHGSMNVNVTQTIVNAAIYSHGPEQNEDQGRFVATNYGLALDKNRYEHYFLDWQKRKLLFATE